jgi:hypothetical protein
MKIEYKFRTRFLVLWVIFAFLLAARFISGQDSAISIDSQVDKSTIRIGDLVTYSVILTYRGNIQVEKPELAANLGAFEIRDYKVHDPVEAGGNIVEKIDYVISTFEVGEFEIPSLQFFYTFDKDTSRNRLETRSLKILVESLKPSEAGDIRDVKPPLGIPREYRRIIIWGSIIFAAFVILTILLYVWHRKRAGKSLLPNKVEPERPADEIAIQALDALKESDLLHEGKVKEYYIQLSDIIRRYIEGRYFIHALELTTYQLIKKLADAEMDSDDIQLVQNFLDECDLVKFAKYIPTAEENDTYLEHAYTIVRQTRLIYERENAGSSTFEEVIEGKGPEQNHDSIDSEAEEDVAESVGEEGFKNR